MGAIETPALDGDSLAAAAAKDESNDGVSRRDFIQLAAAGAATALSACQSKERAAGENATPSESGAKTSAWKSGLAPLHSAIKDARQTVSLNGVWTVTALPLDAEGQSGYRAFTHGAGESVAAQVPGEVHLDLMRAGRMPDPNVSDNARTRCRWPERHSWWYRTEFVLPQGFREQCRQQLIFEGIDLYGQVFVNGKLAGRTKNAFDTVQLDVKRLLQEGKNELVVRVTSGMELPPPATFTTFNSDALKLEPIYAVRSFVRSPGRFLRKPAYATYGWDWCDPLPNIGIWRGVRLEGRRQVAIHHLRLDTAIRDKEVFLEGEAILENLHQWSEIQALLELRLDPPHGKPLVMHLNIGAQVGRSAASCRMRVPDPQLWWPNGMGGQPLYKLTARVVCGNEETDRCEQTIGLRTIELDRAPLPQGSRFCFKVNGQQVYCKGGNWAPADLIPARMNAERYQKLVAEARNAHFNMLRVNGVGLYESDDFYDACDRAGILVWQDFTFSCALYPDQDAEFVALVRNEAEGVVKRLRHHPSLALWCGNNECNKLMTGLSKKDLSRLSGVNGARLYNEVLPDICRLYDPVRLYWPSSPSGGAEINGETAGDRHGPYGIAYSDMKVPATDEEMRLRQSLWQEYPDQWRSRFVSEYGIIGPPNLASVREYLKPDELSLDSAAWKIHTNALESSFSPVAAGIRYHYGQSQKLSLPQFVLYGQLYQALAQGGFVEAMRFHRGDAEIDCQGVLVWSYNDCWGETGWSIIDHYGRRKASYYWFRRACAPVKVLVRTRDHHLVTRVANDTLKGREATVSCGWIRLDGRASELKKHNVTIPANGVIEVARACLPASGERDAREWLYAATLAGEGMPQDQAIWLLAPQCELALAKPQISATVQSGVLRVSSPVYCHGVHLEDEGGGVLADNYFDLLPGIPQYVPITSPAPSGAYSLSAILPIERRSSPPLHAKV